MDAKVTGAFIAQLRREQGLTQKELADCLGVTDKAVSRWETGKGLPDTALLKPLGDVLGVSVGELLAGTRNAQELRDRTDQMLLESLEDPDRDLRKILGFLGIGILVALGGIFFALCVARFLNGPDAILAGMGMYLCIVIVTCTGVVLTRMDRK